MTLQNIIEGIQALSINGNNILGLLGILFVISGTIQISPIKINPWSWTARKIGEAINSGVNDRFEELKKQNSELSDKINAVACEVKEVKASAKENEAINRRVRILSFEREIQNHQKHSEEDYNQVMDDITRYNKYCDTHEKFPNNKTLQTIAHIEKMYQKGLDTQEWV